MRGVVTTRDPTARLGRPALLAAALACGGADERPSGIDLSALRWDGPIALYWTQPRDQVEPGRWSPEPQRRVLRALDCSGDSYRNLSQRRLDAQGRTLSESPKPTPWRIIPAGDPVAEEERVVCSKWPDRP
jgi:hypothetical protein